MTIEYTTIPNYPSLMFHVSRQRAYERHCHGCQTEFTTKWPHGALVAVITDRSGSEQATAHNDKACIQQAAFLLTYAGDDDYDVYGDLIDYDEE